MSTILIRVRTVQPPRVGVKTELLQKSQERVNYPGRHTNASVMYEAEMALQTARFMPVIEVDHTTRSNRISALAVWSPSTMISLQP